MDINNEQPPFITGIAPFHKQYNDCYGHGIGPFAPKQYDPEIWHVKKDILNAAISALEVGLEYAQDCLIKHDAQLGRTTRHNKKWAEIIEEDIENIKKSIV